MGKQKQERNNAVTFKRLRNGKMVIDTKHADVVNVVVAAVNDRGGIETTQFTKERSSDSLRQISAAKSRRNNQNNTTYKGSYDYTKSHENKPKEQPKKKNMFSWLKKKKK